MGAYLNKPVTDKHSETGEGDGLKYGATCMQGWRVNQEVSDSIFSSNSYRTHIIAASILLKVGIFLRFMTVMEVAKCPNIRQRNSQIFSKKGKGEYFAVLSL